MTARRGDRMALRVAVLVAGVLLTLAGAFVHPATAAVDTRCLLPDSIEGRSADAGPLKRDRVRNVRALSPKRVARFGCAWPADVRAIVVTPNTIRLQRGGRVIRQLNYPPGRLHIGRLARLAGDGEWITRPRPDVIELRAPLVQRPGTHLVISASGGLRKVWLRDRRYVYIGGEGARAEIRGVTVTSAARRGRGPDRDARDGRPFIFYERGSRLDIHNSVIRYLGSDRSNAYGITWKTGSHGGVTGSIFEENFFGLYTNRARDLVFRDNIVRYNDLYGLDPHDFSVRLRFIDNTVYRNGSHGIIVSNGVARSVIRGNRSWGNAGNGIVVDKGSPRNLVAGNWVSGNADGIVLLDSPRNRVVGNEVRRNRVGIRVSGPRSDRNRLAGNRLEANQVGIHVYDGADGAVIRGGRIDGGETGMVMEATGSRVRSARVTGARLAIDVRRDVRLEGLDIADVETGIRDSSLRLTSLPSGRIEAHDVGVRQRGRLFGLDALEIAAPRPVVNRITMAENARRPALWWMPFAGIGFILSAVLIELLRNRAQVVGRMAAAPVAAPE